jgi:hypothetical protein
LVPVAAAGPVVSVTIALLGLRRRVPARADRRSVTPTLPLLSLGGALLAFAKWPPGPALIALGLVGGIGIAVARGRRCLSWPRIAWSLAVALAVVGLSGDRIERGLEPHHEGEAVLPAWRIWQGELPYRDFVTIHSVAVDCLPSSLGFLLWGKSVYAERMERGFIATPLRALLIWLLLAALLERPWALASWGLLLLAGAFKPLQTNEAFRLEPALVVLLLYLQYHRGAGAVWLYLTAAAAVVGAVLSPEVGVPMLIGLLAARVAGGVLAGNPGRRRENLLAVVVVGGAGAVATVALHEAGMLAGFLRFLAHMRPLATELVARWHDQTVLDPHVLLHLLVLAASAVALLRPRGLAHPQRALVALLWVVALGLTFSLLADHPTRYQRLMVLDFLLLAAVWRPQMALCPAAAVAVLLGFTLATTGPGWPRTDHLDVPPLHRAGWVTATDPRIGALRLPERDARMWGEFLGFLRGAGDYFNASNSLLDYFLADRPLPMRAIPMHVAYRPADQTELVNTLRSRRPQYVVFRTDHDRAFWGEAPYTLIFNVLDAEIIRHYEFERKIGPYQIVRRSDVVVPRTYNSLLASASRAELDYGWAPYYLGAEQGGGLARVRAKVTAVEPPRRLAFCATIGGGGEARLTIAPRPSVAAPPVTVTFQLADDGQEHLYCVPLWNLCWWGKMKPEEAFRFDVDVPRAARIHHRDTESTETEKRWTNGRRPRLILVPSSGR